MSKGKLQNALDEFVTAIVGIAEETAQHTLAARAKELGMVRHSGRKPMATKPANKNATVSSTWRKRAMNKPCPVVSCDGRAAPRYGMVCKEHSTLSKAKKNAIRFEANQPGGKWATEPAPNKAAKRTKKAEPKKTAKSTKKKAASASKRAASKAKTA